MATLQAAIEAFVDEVRTPDDEPIAFYDSADTSVPNGTTLTDLSRFGYSTLNGDHFLGHWLERPTAATAANLLRRVSSINTTTGAATHDGVAYSGSDTAVLYYRLWRPEWHPRDYVVPLMNRALKEAWTWARDALSIVDNASGEATSVGGSDSSATTTRITTAASVFMGQASFNVALSGANGYHQWATFDAGRGQLFKFYAWVRVTTGTEFAVTIYDITNSAAITTVAVTAGSSWTLVEISGTFPATCDRAAVRIGAASATGVVVVDTIAGYWGDMTLVEGPSWVTAWRDKEGGEAFRLLHFKPRTAGATVTVTGGSATAGPGRAYDAAIIDESDYQILNMPSAANPMQFELGSNLWDKGAIIIEARRPWSHYNSTGSDTALVLDTATNGIPPQLWVKAAKKLYAEERGHPNLKLWQQQYAEEQRRAQSLLQTPTPGSTGLAWRRWR